MKILLRFAMPGTLAKRLLEKLRNKLCRASPGPAGMIFNFATQLDKIETKFEFGNQKMFNMKII